MWVADPAGLIVDIPFWDVFAEGSVDEIKGKRWLKLVHPDDRERVARQWAQAVSTESIYHVEFRVTVGDDTYRWFTVRGAPVYQAEGTIREWVGTATDIEDLKRAEAELERRNSELLARYEAVEAQTADHVRRLRISDEHYRRIVETAQEGIWLLDADRITTLVNEKMAAILGYSVEELKGKCLCSVLGHGDAESAAALMDAWHRADGIQLDAEFRHKDGSTVWCLLKVAPFIDAEGRPDGTLVMATDITERRRLEKMKDEFLSVISHELRTPLNVILGMGSILEDELVGALSEGQHDCLDAMLGGADLLHAHVNDLLDVSSMMAGKFRLFPEPVDLPMLVADALEFLRPQIERHRHTLSNDVPLDVPEIVADPQRIYQVIVKLVTNAIKYTPEGGNIRIHACVVGDHVRLAVQDDGVGIAEADLPHIFQLFTQVDMSSTRPVGGIGLGLALVNSVVEAHGCSVGVESEPGAGSTFWFTLPLRGATS